MQGCTATLHRYSPCFTGGHVGFVGFAGFFCKKLPIYLSRFFFIKTLHTLHSPLFSRDSTNKTIHKPYTNPTPNPTQNKKNPTYSQLFELVHPKGCFRRWRGCSLRSPTGCSLVNDRGGRTGATGSPMVCLCWW